MHSRDFRRPYRPVEIIKQTISDFDQGKMSLDSYSISQVHRSHWVTWEKPEEGWIKLNCDGSLKIDS